MLKTIALARRPYFQQLRHISRCNSMVRTFAAIPTQRTHSRIVLAHSPIHAHQSGNTLTKTPSSPNPILPTIFSLIQCVILTFGKTKNVSQAVQLIQSNPNLASSFSDRNVVRQLAERFANSQTPEHALDILKLAHAFGCQLKNNAYECVCFHLASNANWNLILLTVALGQEHTSHISIRLLNWRARALVEVQDYLRLGGLLEELETFRVKPTRRTFHLIITGHIRNHDLPRAKECLQAMENAGFPADASTHAIVATYYRTFGIDDKVEEQALHHLPSMSRAAGVGVLNSLIRSRLDCDDVGNSLRLLSLFDRRSVESIIKVFLGSDAAKYVADIPQSSFQMEPLVPNASTFSIFVNKCSARGDLAGAFKLMHSMSSQGISPTTSTLTSMVHACFAGGRGDLAVLLVANNCDEESTHRSLFSSILSIPSDSEPDFTFLKLVPPTVHVFNALLEGILPLYGLDGARTVLQIMQINHTQPNAKTLELLLSYLDKVGHAHPRTLIRLMRSLSTPILKPTLKHMHAIFSCVYRYEKFLLHGVGWKRLNQSNSPPRHLPEKRSSNMTDEFDTFAGIVLPHFRHYQSLTKPFLKSLSDRRIKTDSASIAMRIRHAAVVKMDMDSAEDIFHIMLARGMRPNAYHFSALMEGHAVVGNVEAAEKIMNSAKEVGVLPNVVLFTILINGYSRHGNPDMAMRAFRRMVDSGVNPDVPSIDALTTGFYVIGASAIAKRVLMALWTHIEPFPEDLRGLPLLELARHFRSLHPNPSNTTTTISTKERLSLHLKIGDLVKEWQQHGKGCVKPSLPWHKYAFRNNTASRNRK